MPCPRHAALALLSPSRTLVSQGAHACQSSTIKPDQVVRVQAERPEIDQGALHSHICLCLRWSCLCRAWVMSEQPRESLEDAPPPQPIQQSLAWNLDNSVPGIWGTHEDLKGTESTGGGCRGRVWTRNHDLWTSGQLLAPFPVLSGGFRSAYSMSSQLCLQILV